MNKSVKLSIVAAVLILAGVLGTSKYLRWKEERQSSRVQSNLKQLDPAIEESRKAIWEKTYGLHHPRATVQGLKIDPGSKRWIVEVRSFINVAPYAWSSDEIDDAVQLYIDGKLQEKSGLGSYIKKGKSDSFIFGMKSLKPVQNSRLYEIEVLDRRSGDMHKVKALVLGGVVRRADHLKPVPRG